MQSHITDDKENNSEDLTCTVTDRNDDQSNKQGVLLIGEHEHQIAEGGESDLPKLWKNCRKKSGHQDFIPFESFSPEKLPVYYQDHHLYEYIKATADLTVRLSVTINSPERPNFWPNTNDPYYLSDQKGQETFRTGTGIVWNVKRDPDEEPCPCDKCKASGKRSKVWFHIFVQTAAHVVVDDIEARHMVVRLFYDREDSPEVFLTEYVRVIEVNVESDQCTLLYVTCNENIGQKLYKMNRFAYDVRRNVRDKYGGNKDIDKLCFIVSHPHGLSKRVSVGHWKEIILKHMDGMPNRQFTYTTCTCKGSSGAQINCLGYLDRFFSHYHMGSQDDINFSGFGPYFPDYEADLPAEEFVFNSLHTFSYTVCQWLFRTVRLATLCAIAYLFNLTQYF